MTSEGNSALLPANVDRQPPLLFPLHVFLFVLYNKSLNDWSLRNQFILFPSSAPQGNTRACGAQYNAKQCTAVSGVCVLVKGGGGGLVLQRHWHVIVVMS